VNTDKSGPFDRGSEPARDARRKTAPKSRLWLWFVAAFLVQAAAWTAWLIIASKNRVAEVPLTTNRPR